METGLHRPFLAMETGLHWKYGQWRLVSIRHFFQWRPDKKKWLMETSLHWTFLAMETSLHQTFLAMETGLHRTFLAMETTFFFFTIEISSLHQPYFAMETGLHWTFIAMETTFFFSLLKYLVSIGHFLQWRLVSILYSIFFSIWTSLRYNDDFKLLVFIVNDYRFVIKLLTRKLEFWKALSDMT